jgi:hypothetical protein
VPGFSVTVIWGVEPAIAERLELVKVQVVVPLGVPRPSPTATEVGIRLVSVTLTVPAWVTVKVYELVPLNPNPPAKVSGPVDEDVADGDVEF